MISQSSVRIAVWNACKKAGMSDERAMHIVTWTMDSPDLAETQSVNRECPASPLPTGQHQVDTSMEGGPNNCFFCEQPMGKR